MVKQKNLNFSVASTYIPNNIIAHIAKLDSGATQNYIEYEHQHLLQKSRSLNNGPIAILPNESTIQANKVGTLPLHPSLSTKAKTAYVFPHLKNESLLSVGQICDDDCKVLFTKNDVKVIKDDKIIIQGQRSPTDKLYNVHLPQPSNNNTLQSTKCNTINYIIRKDKSKTDLARYLHACAFSPSLSTFTQAIKNGNFITWPGIQNLNFKQLLGTPLATAQGHLDGERKNLQSTKPTDISDAFPPKSETKSMDQFAIIANVKGFTTQTNKQSIYGINWSLSIHVQ